MESYYFIYTRILTEDYQAMYFPSKEQCHRDDFYELMNLARGVINTDSYSPQLDKPIWLLAKHNGYTLWGIGVLNNVLNPVYANDYVGCQIRGFYGLIFKGNPQQLPYDIDFFKYIYDLLIVPNWNANTNTCFHEGVICNVDFSNYSTISAENKNITLNTLPNTSLILGNVDSEAAISQALYDNVGIVVGLSEEAHAFSDRYKYPNIWIEGYERVEYTYPVERLTPNTTGNTANHPNNPWVNVVSTEEQDFEFQGGGNRQSKKVMGPKIVIVVLLAISLGVLCIMKSCKLNKSHLSSQEQVEQQKDTTIIQRVTPECGVSIL